MISSRSLLNKGRLPQSMAGALLKRKREVLRRKLAASHVKSRTRSSKSLLDAKEAAAYLHVSVDWVWDHSTRRSPYLPAIWLSDGALRFRRNRLHEFVDDRERLSAKRRKRR
jgi:hypothetical protein